MRPIPIMMRENMSAHRFYKTCCLKGNECKGRIEWHHAIIFAGRQLNEIWAIVPLCQYHHRIADSKYIKQKVLTICLSRATDEELLAVSKAIDYVTLKKKLCSK